MSAVARRGVAGPHWAESRALAPKTGYQPNDTDRLRLEDLLACGVTLARAAARLGISDDTARYHYRAVVEAAGISARARLAHEPPDRDRAIIRTMVAGGVSDRPTSAAVAAAIFWTKARMGWRERNPGEPDRKADPPVDLRIVPTDQLEKFLAELATDEG